MGVLINGRKEMTASPNFNSLTFSCSCHFTVQNGSQFKVHNGQICINHTNPQEKHDRTCKCKGGI